MNLKRGVLFLLLGILLVLALEILTPINLVGFVIGVDTTQPWHSIGQIDVNSDLPLGLYTASGSGASAGNKLIFWGAKAIGGSCTYDGENSDPLWIRRENIACDDTELRVNIGDYADPSDKFAVGYYSSGTWYPGFVVTADGKVGIGTSSPSQELHINSDDDANIKITPKDNSVGGYIGRYQKNSDSVSGSSYYTYLANGAYHVTSGDEKTFFVHNQFVNGQILQLNSEGFKFSYVDVSANEQQGSATELMRITSTGDVGIGTSTPNRPLRVMADAPGNAHTAAFTDLTNRVGIAIGYVNTISGKGSIQAFNDNYPNENPSRYVDIILNYAGGNVGIGTNNPIAKLEVAGDIKATSGSIGGVTLTGVGGGDIFATSGEIGGVVLGSRGVYTLGDITALRMRLTATSSKGTCNSLNEGVLVYEKIISQYYLYICMKGCPSGSCGDATYTWTNLAQTSSS